MSRAQRTLPGFRSAKREHLHVQALRDGEALVAVIPGIKLVPGDNAREHWATRARRAKNHRSAAEMVLRAKFGRAPELPLVVTITRVGRGRLDTDNLAGSAKHIRDGIADWVGVDDGNDGYAWRYEQSRGDPAVVIRIEKGEA